jgi:hypothetical protein
MCALCAVIGASSRAAIRPSTAGPPARAKRIAAQPPGQSSAAHANSGRIRPSAVASLLGYQTAATRSRPASGPGNSRRATASVRPVPHPRHRGYGWQRTPGNDAVAASASANAGGCGTPSGNRVDAPSATTAVPSYNATPAPYGASSSAVPSGTGARKVISASAGRYGASLPQA